VAQIRAIITPISQAAEHEKGRMNDRAYDRDFTKIPRPIIPAHYDHGGGRIATADEPRTSLGSGFPIVTDSGRSVITNVEETESKRGSRDPTLNSRLRRALNQ